jgi:formylglycine-generating enzyme required for sulfatase activity
VRDGRLLAEADGAELVLVPGDGGSGPGGGLPDFLMDRAEVTRGQYARVMGVPLPAGADPGEPATGIPWDRAAEYAKRVGRRLPTFAEWRRAATGGVSRAYPWGDNDDERKRNGPGGLGVKRVGSYPEGASPSGCLDMAGNAQEWCADAFSGQEGIRVVAGGSYLSSSASDLRIGVEPAAGLPADRGAQSVGFRCAVSLR